MNLKAHLFAETIKAIETALVATRGDQSKAARMLGINRHTLRTKLKQAGKWR